MLAKAITFFSNLAALPFRESSHLLQMGITSMVQMRYCIPEAASLGSMENRSEPRENERLVVYINGRDKSGHAFMQEAVASSLSESGALLSGITTKSSAMHLVCLPISNKSLEIILWLGSCSGRTEESGYDERKCREAW